MRQQRSGSFKIPVRLHLSFYCDKIKICLLEQCIRYVASDASGRIYSYTGTKENNLHLITKEQYIRQYDICLHGNNNNKTTQHIVQVSYRYKLVLNVEYCIFIVQKSCASHKYYQKFKQKLILIQLYILKKTVAKYCV